MDGERATLVVETTVPVAQCKDCSIQALERPTELRYEDGRWVVTATQLPRGWGWGEGTDVVCGCRGQIKTVAPLLPALALFIALAAAACGPDSPATAPEACHELADGISATCAPRNGFNWLDSHGRTGGTCNSAVAFDAAALDVCLAELAPSCSSAELPAACELVITEWAP